MWSSIHHSQTIFNHLMELKLCQTLSRIAIGHITSILIAMFSRGYRGKTVDFALCSDHHRTTIGHFLNCGKWKDEVIQNYLKQAVIGVIYQESERSDQPIFCIVDDTIASHRGCILPSVTFEEKAGLWTSGSCCFAFLQRDYPQLRSAFIQQAHIQNPNGMQSCRRVTNSTCTLLFSL